MRKEQNGPFLISIREQDYSDRSEISKNSFSKLFNRLLKDLNQTADHRISKSEIGEMLEIRPEYFRKLINKEKPIQKRDCVIAICAMLRADTTDTNEALYYCSMPELNDYNKRDEELMDILDNQQYDFLSIKEINDRLRSKGYSELEIIEHRKKADVFIVPSEFKVLKKAVEVRVDDLVYGDIYDSLKTAYRKKPQIFAKMRIVNNDTQYYELYAEPDERTQRDVCKSLL